MEYRILENGGMSVWRVGYWRTGDECMEYGILVNGGMSVWSMGVYNMTISPYAAHTT